MKLFATTAIVLFGVIICHPDFQAATNYVRNGPSNSVHSDDVQLEYYSLFKQATQGNCNKDKPIAFTPTARRKHAAWCGRFGMSKTVAEDKYVTLLTRMVPDWKTRPL